MRICIFGAGAVGSHFAVRVKASDDPAALGPQDFVISTLKATGLSSGNGAAADAARRHRDRLRNSPIEQENEQNA